MEGLMDSKLINILIRTHRRPKGFGRLIESIRSQTYKNYRIIVSVDDEFSMNYVRKMGIDDYVYINRENMTLFGVHIIKSSPVAIYNLYFNHLLTIPLEGYVYCMDDDDYFANENSLQEIADSIEEDTLCIFKMHMQGGNYDIPSHSFGKQITIADVGTPCFCVHSKYASQILWGSSYTADGEYIIELSKIVPKLKWVDKVVYIVPQSNVGMGEL